MPLPTHTPDLSALDLLVTIADRGSIGAAAQALGISQPTASERLRALERRVGLRLLHRAPTGSQLTSEGAAVVDWARGVLDAAHELSVSLAALRASHSGRLRVAASLTVAEHLVPGWLVALAAADPATTVSLRVGNSTVVAELVRGREADLGFVEGLSAPVGLRSKAVAEDELVLVVAAGHPWAKRRRGRTQAELSTAALVTREAGSGTREVFERWMAAAGQATHPALELGSTTAVVQAVLAGTGPAVLSRLAVQSELTDGRLVRVPLGGQGTDHLRRTLRAVWLPLGPPKVGPPKDPARALLGIAAARGANA